MGDIVEFTTWPTHQKTWYKVTSNALRFEIKGQGTATVALASSPEHIAYWIGIGHHNRTTYIRGEDRQARTQEDTPDILSQIEYRPFSLRWCNNTISLFREGNDTPIVSMKLSDRDTNVAKLQYVTFIVSRESTAHWRLEVPPKFPPTIHREIPGGKLHWITADEQLPDGALIGGFEKETLYIIRMKYRGSLSPGKFVPSEGTGYIAWGGEARPSGDFDVLCGFDGIWVATTRDQIPNGAFEGGYSEVNAERLYVGRAYHNGHLIPGKVQPSHKCIYIPFEGKEIGKDKFEVLVDPKQECRCLDRFVPLVSSCVRDSDEEEDHSDATNYSVEDYQEAYAF